MPIPLRLVGALVCALASAFLASCPPNIGAGTKQYLEVLRTSPGEPVDFVHVKHESDGQLSLQIYYAGATKLAEWNQQQAQSSTVPWSLDPRQDFVLSSDWKTLGIRSLMAAQQGSGMPVGSTQQTEFEFLTGLHGTQQPPPVRGGREVLVSNDGSQLLYIQRAYETDGPALVEPFRFNGGVYEQSGSYRTAQQDVAQLSEDGHLIVQGDGANLRIFTAQGEERSPTPAGVGFALSKDGRVLAVREAQQVRFLPLAANGEPDPSQETTVPIPRAIDVQIQQRWAVIYTRSSVHLVEWPTANPLWNKPVTEGVVASADLFVTPSGRFVLAIGRLEAQKIPKRNQGAIDWGGAIGHVDLVEVQGPQNEHTQTHSFRTARWAFDEPRVRILSSARRIVVRSEDVVLVSNELRQSLFQ